ncbi:hypothetical protein LTR53_004477 [Teratosphaeriaceae sp. CCFEE 6253]|nr:hypothetical protein LTR53_004477 [Teratosphaeriaceae sp. CCFEE 6253]
MDFFRLTAPLLRSPQPLLPFLAPSALRQSTQRAIGPVSQRRQSLSTSRPRCAAFDDDISSLLDGALDGNKGTPAISASRTSRFKSNTAQPGSPPSQARSSTLKKPTPASSVDDILDAMRAPAASSRGRTGTRDNFASSFSDISALLNPNNAPPPNPLLARGQNAAAALAIPEKPLPFTLSPSVGRSVTVDSTRGMDIGRAFRTLEMQCARNSVKKDFMRQRFHERPGLKRKRLRSERWRRRFRENFKGTIAMVQGMRAQGWLMA